jgi:HEAT repeat protein
MPLFAPSNVEELKAKRDVPGLIKALAYQKDWHVRQAAAHALGQIRSARAVEPLVVALRDLNWRVRISAAEALGQIGDARALEPLIAALKDQNAFVRTSAAEALRQIGARAVEPLVAALADTNEPIRQASAEALAKIGGPALEVLAVRVSDPDRHVRRRAASALGKTSDPRALDLLRTAKSDPDQSVREVATEGLARQALADKLCRIKVGMTEKELTGLIGQPSFVGRGADAFAVFDMMAGAAPKEAREQENWVFKTQFGDFKVVMRRGRVVDMLTAGLLDRLRAA